MAWRLLAVGGLTVATAALIVIWANTDDDLHHRSSPRGIGPPQAGLNRTRPVSQLWRAI